MLRITDGMMVNNTRRHLNSNLLRLDEFERQIASGKTISRPSDNPAGTVKSLRLRTSLMEGEQYLANINEALSFMQTTDSSLNDVDQLIQAIREKTVLAATGSNSSQSFKAIAQEISELQDQLRIIANATYGSKYIFAGTNVTEIPYENGKWSGNEDWLSVEIGVGVKADINIPEMKSFFMGKMDYTQALDTASGISSLEANNLKEGQYQLATQLGNYTSSNISESQSYLSAVANNKSFFYQDIQQAATLGISRGLFDFSNSNANQLVLQVDQSLYDNFGVIPPADPPAIADGADISAQFDLSALPAGWTATYHDDGQGNVNITFAGATALSGGETISAAPTCTLSHANGNNYVPVTVTFNGVQRTWKSANDAIYSGSLAIEVISVDQGPHMFLDSSNSNASQLVFNVDQSLYQRDASGKVIKLVNDDDISSLFDLSALPTYTDTFGVTKPAWAATYNDNGQGVVTVTFKVISDPEGDLGIPAAASTLAGGETITAAAASNICNSNGNNYNPATATFDGVAGKWDYHGVSNITANIKGHVYGIDGTLRNIELKNVVMNMEAEVGEAIFSIDSLDIDSSGDSAFTNDLVVWNNGTAALGGINLRTAALQAGDKTILNFGAQAAVAGAEKISLNYNFTDIDGNQIGNGGLSYVFDALTMDNKTKELKFFTMDQITGVVQDAAITFKTNTLGTSASAAAFDYTAGLFGYLNELCGTIESGKIPQVGNMLKGIDDRLQELLYHRSTIGARVNRLELQQSRLQNAETTLTDLLAKNEDTDEARVIMELKMQENVYQASLAVGARIIQPTLIDYLS
ncbi:MAG: flagellar hook-associated protein FlgL [Syntrophomonadaceae bacterium]|nr:flagellar hook-associated protein FlgL [Syntrophomonadaceae bacterium]